LCHADPLACGPAWSHSQIRARLLVRRHVGPTSPVLLSPLTNQWVRIVSFVSFKQLRTLRRDHGSSGSIPRTWIDPVGFLPPWNLPCPRCSNRDWAVSFFPSIRAIKSLFPINGRAVHGGVALIPRGSLLHRDPSSPIYVADLESFSSYFLLLLANFTGKVGSESTLLVNRLPQPPISASPLLVWCTSFGSVSPPFYVALVNR
jgi:hypothetical protein